eukprot:3139772-Rhodomonas_salina.1
MRLHHRQPIPTLIAYARRCAILPSPMLLAPRCCHRLCCYPLTTATFYAAALALADTRYWQTLFAKRRPV